MISKMELTVLKKLATSNALQAKYGMHTKSELAIKMDEAQKIIASLCSEIEEVRQKNAKLLNHIEQMQKWMVK